MAKNKKFEVTYTTPPDSGASTPETLPKSKTKVTASTPEELEAKLDDFTRGGEHEIVDAKKLHWWQK
jgi:hypothetical protein